MWRGLELSFGTKSSGSSAHQLQMTAKLAQFANTLITFGDTWTRHLKLKTDVKTWSVNASDVLCVKDVSTESIDVH